MGIKKSAFQKIKTGKNKLYLKSKQKMQQDNTSKKKNKSHFMRSNQKKKKCEALKI